LWRKCWSMRQKVEAQAKKLWQEFWDNAVWICRLLHFNLRKCITCPSDNSSNLCVRNRERKWLSAASSPLSKL
jgi:hypothetical protein